MNFKKVLSILTSFFISLSSMNFIGLKAITKQNDLKEILYMNFDDGNLQDLSGLNNHGVEIGKIDFVEGVYGKAAHILNDTGSSSELGENYIDLGNSEKIRLGIDDFSISFWYRSGSGNESGGTIISSKNYNSGSNEGFAIGSFTKEIRANFGGKGNRRDIKFSPVDNTWHHSVVSVDRDGNMITYTDGVKTKEIDISDFSDVDAGEGHLMIGADGYGCNSLLDSYIDEIHIYKGIVSSEKVKELYEEVKNDDGNPDESNGEVVLDVSFDGNVKDKSAYGNDGDIIGEIKYVDGIKGKAVHIKNSNGSSSEVAKEYINFGNDASLKFSNKDFSISFWYNSDNGVSAGGTMISNKNFNSGSNPGFAVGDFDTGIRMNFTAEGQSRKDVYNFAPIDGNWHKIDINIDRDGYIDTYLDGNKKESVSIKEHQGRSIDVADFVVGADGYGRNGLNDAYIDELKVSKSILDPKNIKEVYLTERLDYEISSSVKFYEEAIGNAYYDKEVLNSLASCIEDAKKLIGSNNESAILDISSQLTNLKEALQTNEKVVQGQMLYLNFDEGTVEDVSGRENHGNAHGDIRFENGVDGKCIHIVNDNNGSVSAPATSFIDFKDNKDFRLI